MDPPPSGAETAAATFQRPPRHSFQKEDEGADGGWTRAKHVPEDAEYQEAVAAIVEAAADNYLVNYPGWHRKFLEIMVTQFGADVEDPDDIAESWLESMGGDDEAPAESVTPRRRPGPRTGGSEG